MSENTCFFRHLTDKWVPANKMLLAGRVPENNVFFARGVPLSKRCYMFEWFMPAEAGVVPSSSLVKLS